MALYDTADLLARCQFRSRRPASDESMTPQDWYNLLTDAQMHWVRQFATHFPEQMYESETLTTADSGVTYTFQSEPLGHYELRASATGRLLAPGPDWDMAADYVANGQTIRFPGGRAKTFPSGPVARYVKTPNAIDSSNEPTLKPVHTRQLLVARACIEWAERGGMEDPQPYMDWENRLWYGDPATGQMGILGALKNERFLQGTEALPAGSVADWWRFVDDGSGYIPGTG